MLFLLKLLKSSKHTQKIINKKIINKNYKYWKVRIFYSLFLGYMFFYFTRKSFTFIMPLLIKDLHLSISDLGIINTLFYITYAFSKLTSGILSDKSNPRYFMSLGLILTGIFNICIGLSYHTIYLSIFWILNAIFQGWGWPAVTKQLTYWFNKQERGLWWSLCSTSHNIGGAIIPLFISYSSAYLGWRYSMYLTGILSITIGILLINRLRDIPETLGLPSTEIQYNNKYNKLLNTKEIIFKYIINNKIIWLLSISYFFIYIIRTAINDWTILYLMNQKGYSLLSASISIFWFEIGGLIGMITSGRLTDIFFKGKRLTFITICTIGLMISSIILWNLPVGYKLIDYIIIGIIGFLTFAPQMLIGLTASEAVNKRIACTANGFVGCWAYIGAAITGYPLGLIINLSWNIYFLFIIISSIIIIFPILLCNIEK